MERQDRKSGPKGPVTRNSANFWVLAGIFDYFVTISKEIVIFGV